MKLSVLKKNQLIQEIDLGKDVLKQDYSETTFLIGRSKDCSIVLDDKKISREHAKLIHQNGRWFIEKIDPENSGKINGDDFDRYELSTGDVFTAEGFSINVLSMSEEDHTKQTSHTISIEKEKTNVELPQALVTPVVKEEYIPEALPELEAKEEISGPGEGLQDSSTSEFFNPMDEESIEEQTSNDEFLSDVNEEIQESEFGEEDANFDLESAQTEGGVEFSEENNDMYSLENIDDGSNDNEGTVVIQSFASIYLELFGETAPYDKFIVDQEKIFIGRDPAKCQIILNDSEVSGVHAVLTRTNILLTLEDLNSSNGTIYKGDRINKVNLGHNDEFVIGGVTFTVKIRSEFLKEESATLMAVDENQMIEVEEVVEEEAEEGKQFDALGEEVEDAPVEKSIIKRIWKDEQKRKKVIYGAVLLVGAWAMFSDDSTTTPPKQPTTQKAAPKKTPAPKNDSKVKFSEEELRALSSRYEIGKNHFNEGRFREALTELQFIFAKDPNFNQNLQSMIALSKEGLRKIEEAEQERQAKIAAAERKAKVASLLEKAREYTKDRRVDLATTVFNEITQIEPENYEVSKMKLELDDWQKEKQRKELEEIQKKKDRQNKEEQIKPSRTLYLQKDWFYAINKLEDFLKIPGMDDDLTTEATNMLRDSREQLSEAVSPLIGKAKSLLEGQDLKGAYEVYQQVLKVEPSNAEALNQISDIREQLTNRARKIYREAIIAESLSLFQEAKEKFQEVQQISPVDSEYYIKATNKLKEHLDY